MLDVLLLHARGINLLSLFFLLSDGSRHTCRLGSGARHLGGFEAVGSLHLGLLAQILDLGLAEHNVGVGGGVLVNVRLVDDKEDVLRLPDGHPADPSNLLETELAHDLPRLLLAPALLALVLASNCSGVHSTLLASCSCLALIVVARLDLFLLRWNLFDYVGHLWTLL